MIIEQEEDGWFVLSHPTRPVYGDGATLEEARADYVRSLRDYEELLAADVAEKAEGEEREGDPCAGAQADNVRTQ